MQCNSKKNVGMLTKMNYRVFLKSMNDDVDDHEEMRSEEEGKRGRFSERERERDGKTAFHIYRFSGLTFPFFAR